MKALFVPACADPDSYGDACDDTVVFTLSFVGPDMLDAGGPGALVSATYDCVMTPSGTWTRSGHQGGAQGWTISIASEGLEIVGATVEGTAAGERSDGPPGLRFRGLEKTELATGDGLRGAVSAVVLSTVADVTLPLGAPSVICKISVEGPAPETGAAQARLSYIDGLQGRGTGQPVTNLVSWRASGIVPLLQPKTVLLSFSAEPFRRGDANDDGRVDVSDSIFILNYLFLRGRLPSCLDAADIDNSGRIDITDGLAGFDFLFPEGAEPPPPGPFRCGEDPERDALGCRDTRCP